MIQVSRIVASMRYALRDMQGLTYSDYELVESINQAASLLYGVLAENYVHKALKKTVLIVDNTQEASLPSDFVSIHRVGMGDEGYASPVSYKVNEEGTYRIMNDMFYAPEGAYSLEYYYVPRRVTSLNDILDVPLSMSPFIEQISIALFTKDTAGALAIAEKSAQMLSGGEFTHYDRLGPVEILGGKV